MRRLILKSFQSPGDILMMTAAVRDLHAACPGQFKTDVRTSADALWLNNPYITQLKEGAPGIESIKMEYPLIHQSNQRPYHFIHGYPQFLEQHLKVRIPVTRFHGDVHLTPDEKTAPPPGADAGLADRFWIVIAGGKYDFTAKWWNPASYQKVIDHFKGRIQFVQCGEKGHWHRNLNGVINLVGRTSLREFIRLMYHAEGVLCPVTFAMHLAAAVETKPGRPKKRACVVVAGGREPTHWEAYPTHQYISTVGSLSCCAEGGCWKSRCQLVGDGDQKDTRELCEKPVQVTADLRIPECMEMIRPEDVIRRIEMYSGANGTPQKTTLPTNAQKEPAVAVSPFSNRKPSPKKGSMMNVLIQFNHGLGDAVQLTVVLQHLRKFRPEWQIDVCCLRGKHTALRGLCRKAYHDQEPAPDKSAYNAHYDLGWYECYSVFSDSPSTKACNCLREVFRIAPVPEFCGYFINPEPNDFTVTATYLESIGCRRGDTNRYNAVILHYQGNTSGHKKNLDHHTASAASQEVIAAGFVPVVLDWDRRSPLPNGKTIFCPAVQKGDIWGEFGSGDAARIAALVAQASLFVGIDSGPAKAAATTNTPNICVWTGHHPLQFHDLTKTHHLVPENHLSLPPANNSSAAAFFAAHYDFSIYPKGKLTDKLCETIRRFIGTRESVPTGAQDAITSLSECLDMASTVGVSQQIDIRREGSELSVAQTPTGAEGIQPDAPRLLQAASPTNVQTKNVLLEFRHGLGDAVQFNIVLKHLRHYHPDWNLDVAALVGKHSVFRGLCRRVFVADWSPLAPSAYDHYFKIDWNENHTDYAHCPSTKAARCLTETFKLDPVADLFRYSLNISNSAYQAARGYLRGVCKKDCEQDSRFSAVLIHYQGNTSQDKKDLPHDLMREVCNTVIRAEYTPVILDWDRRSPLPDDKTIYNPKADHDIWGHTGTGDGEVIAALIESSRLMIGIDSGPLHVAGATSTPAIGLWTRHHPVHYFDLADNVFHFVPQNHDKVANKGQVAAHSNCLQYFLANYKHHVYGDLAVDLRLAVTSALKG